MSFTPAQITLIKADIAASADMLGIPAGDDGSHAIAQLYSLLAAPEFIVWKTNVVVDEIMREVMDWVRAIALSPAQANAWDLMTKTGTINAAKLNVRAGIEGIWSAPADATLKAGMYTLCKRPATRLEKLLSTGTGTTVAPATMGREGGTNYAQIQAARIAP